MNPEIKSIEQEAAQWRTLLDLGGSPEQEERFASWLEDPRHAQAYEAMDRTWDRLERVKFTPEGRALEQELEQLGRKLPAKLRWLAVALTAAAALTWGYLGWYRPMNFTATAVTAVGQFSKFDLPDGSVIQLNTDSVLEVRFSREIRSVKLIHGEAHFSVAKNKDRSFIVTANGVTVRAVGTAFGVRIQAMAVEVLVTEGKVRVDEGEGSLPSDSAPQFLVAGERAVIGEVAPVPAPLIAAPLVNITKLPPEEITRALAWQDRKLVFVSAPLSEIIAEFNRYNERKLVIADPELAAARFGGTFQADEPQTLVQLLASAYDVKSRDLGNKIILQRSAR